jgi:23S rRNA (uracil1939-C5)-methyltransferase
LIRRVEIADLAPTGEGIARGSEAIGFVEGALPGEEVDAEVRQVRKRFWRGRTVAVHRTSPDRVTGPHTTCAGCDWAHFEPAAARRAKQRLFRETMARIGRLPAETLGELPVVPSPPGYRLRTRFHVERSPGSVRLGFFEPGSHRLQPAAACQMLTPQTRALLPRLQEALARSGAPVSEVATLESLDGERRLGRLSLAAPGTELVSLMPLLSAMEGFFAGFRIEDVKGRALATRGEKRLLFPVEGRELGARVDTFFQANRYLLSALYREVREQSASRPAGDALDAYGGVGLFAGALLDAGHRVLSVEADLGAAGEAERTRRRWQVEQRWRIVRSPMLPWLLGDPGAFEVTVVDPPRAGLGIKVARRLAESTRSRLLYVSCEPATIARDLGLLAQAGFSIASARLFDLFLFTHRIEAVISLDARGTR